MKYKKAIPAVVLGVSTFLVAACGTAPAKTEGTTGKGFLTRDIVMSDYKFEPDHFNVPAGRTVRLVVRNDGAFTHEFRVLVDPPKYVEVAPKSKDRLDIVFEKGGAFEYVCTVGDHERLGMKGEITVEEVE